MNKSYKNLCLVSAISFIVGVAVAPLAVGAVGAVVGFSGFFFTNRQSQEQEAKSFFYRTMNAIFEDTYNAEEGSVSPDFMNKYKKYEPQLGEKCRLYIIDSTSGYYECIAFFPSGDVFGLAIVLENESWILHGFHPVGWDYFWRDAIKMSKNLRLAG